MKKMIIHASSDIDVGLRDSILAPSPNISPKVFAKLAHDEAMAIRMGVAMNRCTPPEVLAELAHDREEYVRIEVAINRNTSPETLAELTHDESETVRREAYHNLSGSDNLDTDYSTTSEEVDFVGEYSNRDDYPEYRVFYSDSTYDNEFDYDIDHVGVFYDESEAVNFAKKYSEENNVPTKVVEYTESVASDVWDNEDEFDTEDYE